MEWLLEYAPVFDLGIGLATIALWILYAHLLLEGFRRQRRPKVLVNQGVGTNLDSRCLVSNMSQEAIHVETLFGVLATKKERFTTGITDYEARRSDEALPGLREGTVQGPVKSGDFIDMGDFRSVVNRIARDHGLPLTADGNLDLDAVAVETIEIVVIAIYGPEDHPVAALRPFRLIKGDAGMILKPKQVSTRQMASRRDRKQVEEWVKAYL